MFPPHSVLSTMPAPIIRSISVCFVLYAHRRMYAIDFSQPPLLFAYRMLFFSCCSVENINWFLMGLKICRLWGY